MYRLGSGYIGSPYLQTTSAPNEEIVPSSPEHWSRGYNFYSFSFINNDDCTVVINHQDDKPIFLKANQGFSMSSIDAPIYSFKIKEANVLYNYVAAF